MLATTEVGTEKNVNGMAILLTAASGITHKDPNMMILALQTICHMVTPRSLVNAALGISGEAPLLRHFRPRRKCRGISGSWLAE